ncbi:MAG: glycoside hydrolase family 127 protein [Clostridia bacterium]|nr:glycoside hydrolase family 127 protein [Clostridia bacterium]
MVQHPVIKSVYAPGTAYAAHAGTDRFFQLSNGSYCFEGVLKNAIRLIEKKQLMDRDLWKLFVEQFRKGNADDHNRGWRCEYWGKMMRGACMVYQCAPSDELYAVIEETVLDMLTTQDRHGRFATYSEENELDGWDLWGRKYIFLGMQHFLEICRDKQLYQKVLTALDRHADAIMKRVGPEEEGKKEILKASRHWDGLNSGSLLEPIMRMHQLTGDEKYLDFACYIVSRGGTSKTNLFELAYEGTLAPYQFPITKAYEMISNFEGLLEYYRVTGEEKWKVACINLADKIAETDVTIIGCSGCTHELFDHSAVRQFDAEEKGIMQETCVTVTWMKFCWQMLCLTGESKWADRMEWSLYNALLGSVNTDVADGLPFDSYSPLLPGTRGRVTGGFQKMENDSYYGCCACIGAAGLGLGGIAQAVCAQDGTYLNFYMPGTISTLTPAGKKFALETRTNYPLDGQIDIAVSLQHSENFTLGLRIPAWSKASRVYVNQEEVQCSSGTYLKLNREWKNGDSICIVLDLRIAKILPEAFGVSSSKAPYIALHQGPVVLARDERLGMGIEQPVTLMLDENGFVCTENSAASPFSSMIALDVKQQDGTVFPVVDYASAGKTWTEESRMCAWMKIKEAEK